MAEPAQLTLTALTETALAASAPPPSRPVVATSPTPTPTATPISSTGRATRTAVPPASRTEPKAPPLRITVRQHRHGYLVAEILVAGDDTPVAFDTSTGSWLTPVAPESAECSRHARLCREPRPEVTRQIIAAARHAGFAAIPRH